MDYTHTRPAARLHVSGDPEGGWIAELHDHSEPVTLQTEEPHPTSVEDVLDALHAKYEEVKEEAIEGWDSLKEAFLAAWDEKHPEAAQAEPEAEAEEEEPPPAPTPKPAAKPAAKPQAQRPTPKQAPAPAEDED